jgi:hypothetical protein
VKEESEGAEEQGSCTLLEGCSMVRRRRIHDSRRRIWIREYNELESLESRLGAGTGTDKLVCDQFLSSTTRGTQGIVWLC